ncbi:MAG: helix-turn-helix domain-containing protein [Actinobacteria bacterium]|nr:helix-turn-helix domain-containing protein [Actinomycetota bacterium]
MALDERIKTEQIDDLFEAILKLKTKEEAYKFFEDLSTIAEIKSMAQRWAVARKLDAGETYIDIATETGASTATISRVKRYLEYGADGYRLVLDRMKLG